MRFLFLHGKILSAKIPKEANKRCDFHLCMTDKNKGGVDENEHRLYCGWEECNISVY